MEYKRREDVEKEYTWDLTDRFKNYEEWKKEYKSLKKDIHKITEFNDKILDSETTFYNTLETYYDLETRCSKLYVYAFLKYDENLFSEENSLHLNEILSLYSEFITLSSFICPEILRGKKSLINKYLKDKKLAKYKFTISNILRGKEHSLSKNEELIFSKLTASTSVFDKISSMLTDSTLNYGTLKVDGEMVTLTNNNYRHIMTNRNRKTRKECYNLLTNKLKEFSNIFAELLITNMKSVSTMANIKNFSSTLDMQLFSSNIPKEVIDNLYKVVHKRLDVFGSYLQLLKENIGLETLEFYDLQTEFLPSTLTFSIEDAQMLIIEATKIYGEEYNNIIKKAFTDRWIDYGSYKGKKSGAYSISNYPDSPKVLTSFHGKFTDVSTIAHELGHAVNFYLSEKNNDKHNYQNDIFVAEVASLTNEIILSSYIFHHCTDKNLKLTAIYNLIDILQNNIFDACLEGELENKMYELIDHKEEIDVTTLSNCIYDLRNKYYQNNVKLDENVKYLWARRSHYYSPFYLFQYATGASAATYIATKILNGDEKMKKDYIKFLSSGDTDYGINLLKNIGIDMTKQEVYNNAIDYFKYLIDEFNKVSEE